MKTFDNDYKEMQFEKRKVIAKQLLENIQNCKVKIPIVLHKKKSKISFLKLCLLFKNKFHSTFNVSKRQKVIKISDHKSDYINELIPEKTISKNITSIISTHDDKSVVNIYCDIDSRFLSKI